MDSASKEDKIEIEVREHRLRHQDSFTRVDRSDTLTTLPEYAEKDPRLSCGEIDDVEANPSSPLAQRWHNISWKPEVGAWIASFCFFVCIVVVLSIVEGKPVPKLPLGLSVNAVISFLGTLMEFFLMVTVSSCLGQTKWFRSSRGRIPMNHFHLIDQASRGPWGSFKLLVRRAGGIIGSAGAVLSMLSLPTNTFVQQTLNFETMYPVSGEARMPFAQYMNGTGSTFQGAVAVSLPKIDSPMLLSPYNGIFSEAKTAFATPAECPTGNCTWPTYHTMAFCSTCEDITSRLRMQDILLAPLNSSHPMQIVNNYTLPNGFGINGKYIDRADGNAKLPLLNITTTAPVAVPARRRFRSVAFNNTGSVLLSIFAVGAPPGKAPIQPDYNTTGTTDYVLNGTNFAPPIAYECALRFCFHEMSASFQNGTLVEKVVNTWMNDSQLEPRFRNWSSAVQVDFRPQTANGQVFSTNNNAWRALELYLGNMFYGNVTGIAGVRPFRTPLSSTPVMQAIYMSMNTSATGFPDVVDNVARSLSQSLRKLSYQPGPIKGAAYGIDGRFRVRWEWLALPVFELVASLAFLVAVMLETRRSGLVPWTNSILGVLFHGLDIRPGGHGLQESERAMEQTAQGYLVHLKDEGDGGQLALDKG